MKDWGFSDDAVWQFKQGTGKPCGGSYISSDKTCRVGGGEYPPLKNEVDNSLDDKFAPTAHDLDMMQAGFENATANGDAWSFPFEIPAAYNDSSGTPEAVDEVVSLRASLKQDKQSGKIEVPADVKMSSKARALLDEYNKLDLDILYTDAGRGVELNVSGLGVMAGPRDSVPKDSIRGFVQYVALRRQDATLIDTPTGKMIQTYRDPFTGTPRGFYGTKIPDSGTMKGQTVTAIKASQDHWNRPFGVYGAKSEGDVRNTVFMPGKMNSAKGEKSPTRFAYTTLVKEGRITDKAGVQQDKTVLGGLGGRFAKAGPKYDFLGPGMTRASEKAALRETATSMIAKANRDVSTKYVPRMQTALAKGKVKTYEDAAKLFQGIAKQESTTNYFGGLLRFTPDRVIRPAERQFVKGVDLSKPTGSVKAQIAAAMKASGMTPQEIIALNLSEHT